LYFTIVCNLIIAAGGFYLVSFFSASSAFVPFLTLEISIITSSNPMNPSAKSAHNGNTFDGST
jgi:hypothetical protein